MSDLGGPRITELDPDLPGETLAVVPYVEPVSGPRTSRGHNTQLAIAMSAEQQHQIVEASQSLVLRPMTQPDQHDFTQAVAKFNPGVLGRKRTQAQIQDDKQKRGTIVKAKRTENKRKRITDGNRPQDVARSARFQRPPTAAQQEQSFTVAAANDAIQKGAVALNSLQGQLDALNKRIETLDQTHTPTEQQALVVFQERSQLLGQLQLVSQQYDFAATEVQQQALRTADAEQRARAATAQVESLLQEGRAQTSVLNGQVAALTQQLQDAERNATRFQEAASAQAQTSGFATAQTTAALAEAEQVTARLKAQLATLNQTANDQQREHLRLSGELQTAQNAHEETKRQLESQKQQAQEAARRADSQREDVVRKLEEQVAAAKEDARKATQDKIQKEAALRSAAEATAKELNKVRSEAEKAAAAAKEQNDKDAEAAALKSAQDAEAQIAENKRQANDAIAQLQGQLTNAQQFFVGAQEQFESLQASEAALREENAKLQEATSVSGLIGSYGPVLGSAAAGALVLLSQLRA